MSNDAHGHGHNPNLAHHFDSMDQQNESGKTGMWLFLATEILLFGGLFVAYSVWRSNHHEIFITASKFLDTKWGAINTAVLIVSSFTMAMAVRSAQTNNQKALKIYLVLTLLCAGGFMGIKAIEYKAKIQHGLLPGRYFKPDKGYVQKKLNKGNEVKSVDPSAAPAAAEATKASVPQSTSTEGLKVEKPNIPPAADGPQGLANITNPADHRAVAAGLPAGTQTFFSIYFGMTGLHALHVLFGMIAITWVLIRSSKGHFNSKYFLPVDLVGLYWHLVDLIWIYLFPLLYLIH